MDRFEPVTTLPVPMGVPDLQREAFLRRVRLVRRLSLEVTDDGVVALARIAAEINGTVENIGARRLQTVMERVLDEVSFTATDRSGETVVIDAGFVEKNLGDLSRNTDLSKFIL